MKALLQRVQGGSVSIAGETISSIGKGLVILLGVSKNDTVTEAAFLAKKTAALRIFADEQDKLNLSLKDTGGEALVVSQFTLYADCSSGNRPGFEPAAPHALAKELYGQFINMLKEQGIPVKEGVFQANMLVSINNDGPVTILLERNPVT